MRKLWFGLMMIAPTCLPARASEPVVAASSAAPRSVAASTPAAAPAAVLGSPRVLRATGDIVPAGFVEPASAPALSRIPAATSEPLLRPEMVPAPREGASSGFAVERTALLVPDRAPPAVAPEKLSFLPQSGASGEPLFVTDGYAGEFVDGPAPSRLYGSAEYLAWRTRNANVPPLATTSNPNTIDFGRIGQPTTQVLFDDELDHGMQSGGRFRLGYWLPTEKPMALEASFFILGTGRDNFSAAADSTQILARPFFNGNQGIEFSELIAAPGVSFGSIAIDSSSNLFGGELNLRCPLWCQDSCNGGFKLDLLAGGRFLRLNESLTIIEQGVGVPPNPDAGQLFQVTDRFDTKNTFLGGQLGLAAGWQHGRWSVDARASVALGNTHQVSEIQGSTLFINPNGTAQSFNVGLLALGSNSGRATKDRFSVVPEAGLSVGYQVNDWMKASVGYNFLYWSSVLRPGDQIDRTLDVTQIPGFTTPLGNGTFAVTQPDGSTVVVRPLNPPRPVQPLKDSSFWAQGLTLGLELKY